MHRLLNRLGAAVAILLATVLAAPQVLAFPYRQSFGATVVRSDRPIPAATAAVLTRAEALLRASPIYAGPVPAAVFLTDGGWRWHLLALTDSDGFALSRPLTPAIVVNRSDPGRDLAFDQAGDRRTLSGVIAHERTHQMTRARYGVVADALLPAWKREGYADYVARESTLSDAAAARLEAADRTPPPLFYWHARRRVAAALATNGGSVDALMAGGG